MCYLHQRPRRRNRPRPANRPPERRPPTRRRHSPRHPTRHAAINHATPGHARPSHPPLATFMVPPSRCQTPLRRISRRKRPTAKTVGNVIPPVYGDTCGPSQNPCVGTYSQIWACGRSLPGATAVSDGRADEPPNHAPQTEPRGGNPRPTCPPPRSPHPSRRRHFPLAPPPPRPILLLESWENAMPAACDRRPHPAPAERPRSKPAIYAQYPWDPRTIDAPVCASAIPTATRHSIGGSRCPPLRRRAGKLMIGLGIDGYNAR